MKARRKNSNDEWKEVKYIQLEDSDILYKQEYLEFDNSERTHKQIANDTHWQDVRERAAIAAMQGTITILSSSDKSAFREIVIEGFRGDKKTYPNEIAEFAVACADALVKQLKEQNNEKN